MMVVFKFIVIYLGTIFASAVVTQILNNKKIYIPGSDFLDKFLQSDYKLNVERGEVVRISKQYMKKFQIVTFKYNRTCTAFNLTWMYLADVGFDQNLVVQAYKFASNEYRLFPLRFQINLCDAISKDIGGLQRLITNCGNFTGCPFLKNRLYHACYWTPDESHFPPHVPNGQYMVEMQGLFRMEEVFCIRAYLTIHRPFVKK